MATELQTLTLNNVHLKGFKSIEDLIVDFNSGLNILIGKNASGKSNLLEGLFTIVGSNWPTNSFRYSKLEYATPQNYIIGIELERHILNHKEGEEDNPENRIKFSQKLYLNEKEAFDSISLKYNNKLIRFNGVETPARGSLTNIIRRLGFYKPYPLYIKFNLPGKLDCVASSGTLKITFEDDGFDLWSDIETLNFLFSLFASIETKYDGDNNKIKNITKASFYKQLRIPDDIKTNLKKFSPIQDIRFNENINVYKDEKSITIDNLKIDFKVNGNWMPWSQLSDGTKRLFYLIAEITHRKDGLILVEEPELGIHPHQFHLVMQFLKEQSETKQIIISTHSPQALNCLSQDELNNILITKYDTKRGTQIKHLTKPQITKAKKYMKEVGFLSDYWMLSPDLEE